MTGETVPADAGTAESEATDLAASFEAAEQELGTGHQDATSPSPAPAPPAGTAAEEPEHVRWAKSVDGHIDPATGQWNYDRLTKRAFELNRQNQAAAQRWNQIERLLKHPEVLPTIQRVLQGNQAAQPQEKSDEEVLREFVDRVVQTRLEPILPRVEQYRQERVNLHMDQVYDHIRKEFGQGNDGTFLYDSIAPQLAESFSNVAQRLNVSEDQLLTLLVDRGQLYSTIRTMARDLLWEQHAAATQQAQSNAVDRLKRTRTSPGRGTPSANVRQSKEPKTLREAAEAAEQELREAGISIPA